MRFAWACIVSLAIPPAWAALPAPAQTVPPALGADLTRSCGALIAYAKQGGEITVDATSCAAYLKGLRDAVDAYSRTPVDKPFCAEGAGLHEMAQAVVKHLEGQPESARRSASVEARAALTRAYPCAPKK